VTVEAESNRKSDLRLGPGNLAEGASPHRGSSTAGESVEVASPIACDQSSTDDYKADEEEGEEEEGEEDGGEGEDGEEWDGGGRPAKRRRTGLADSRPRVCCCSSEVPRALLAKCSSKRAAYPGNQVRLVKGWVRHAREGSDVCFHHGRRVASAIGMQTRNLNAVTVKRRLRRYHRATLQNAVGGLKAGNDTYAWNRRGGGNGVSTSVRRGGAQAGGVLGAIGGGRAARPAERRRG
jgi:hypothetical protein